MSLTDKQNERNDLVDNACHQLLCTVAGREIDWDMEHIGEVADTAEEIVCDKLGIMSRMECRPFVEGA